MMQSFVRYFRVSTTGQATSGLGLEAQERDVQLYLDNYLDDEHEVIATFTEVDSGGKESRAELAKAIEVCKRNKATLIVSKVDRLSRDIHHLSGLMKDKRLDFRVASLPSADKNMLYFYGIMAEMERDFISTRTKAALAAAKARGVKLGGARPEAEARHKAVRDEADARAKTIAPTITSMRESGSTWDEIAMQLNAMSVPTARGGKWYGKTVLNAANRL